MKRKQWFKPAECLVFFPWLKPEDRGRTIIRWIKQGRMWALTEEGKVRSGNRLPYPRYHIHINEINRYLKKLKKKKL